MRGIVRHCGLLIAMACVGLLGAAPAAYAGVTVYVSPTMGPAVSAGQLNQPGSISLQNASSPPDTGTMSVSDIRLTPSCHNTLYNPSCGNGNPADQELNVFSIDGTATGSGDCAGTTFTVTETNPATEDHTFTASPAVSLELGEACLISFTFDVLKVPDFDAVVGGAVQTYAKARATAVVGAAPPDTDVLNELVTVGKASPTIGIAAAPAGVTGAPVIATATLASASFEPSGPVDFALWPPSDPTCAGVPTIITAPLSPAGFGGTAQAQFIPTTPGVYRWSTRHQEDHDNLQAGPTPCNGVNSTTDVALPPPPAAPSTTQVKSGKKKCKKGRKLRRGKCRKKKKR